MISKELSTTCSEIKSRSRVKERGEVFTGLKEVKAMCNLCEPEISKIDKKVLEPGCGNGNFLIEILARKLQRTKNDQYKILIALSSIYGIDIAPDNVVEARSRMRNLIFDQLGHEHSDGDFLVAVDIILKHNIVVGDLLMGRKNIVLINWTPIGDHGFELEKWHFSDIERARSNVVIAKDFSNISAQVFCLLQSIDASKSRLKPRPKPRKSQFEDLPIFSKRSKK